MILFYHLIEKRGEIGAGWSFEITEFFQCNRGARVATNVDGFRGLSRGHRFISGNGQALRLHCLAEQRASEHGRRGDTNDDKRQIAFHKRHNHMS